MFSCMFIVPASLLMVHVAAVGLENCAYRNIFCALI
jgi:hypothetical protein